MSIEKQLEEMILAELNGKTGTDKKKAPAKKAKAKPEFNKVSEEASVGTVKWSVKYPTLPLPDLGDIDCTLFDVADWEEADQAHIPNVDKFDNYVPNVDVLAAIEVNVLENNKMLIVGPTGSGKTSIQEYYCAYTKQPYYRFNGRQDMESDTIIGKPWVNNGSMEYIIGNLPKKAQAGYFISFDEPWKTPSGIQMTLQRFYEQDGVFQMDDMPGELDEQIITPDARCQLVLSDNVVGVGDGADKYGATMIQDGSTLNRIDVVVEMPYMPQDKEAEMVTKAFPAVPAHMAEKMVKLFSLMRINYEQGELSSAASPRNLIAWAKLATRLRSYEKAFTWTMLKRFPDDNEQATVKAHYSTVFGKNL